MAEDITNRYYDDETNILTQTESFYVDAGRPLDIKQTPVNAYSELLLTKRDLGGIPITKRYVGMTITVLNTDTTNIPTEYWLVGGKTNASWKLKAGNIVDTKENLLAISPSACTLGLEMVVQADESNNGEVTKYWVTSIANGEVTWSRKQYGAQVTVTGEDQEESE
jgi:hypothetical protein